MASSEKPLIATGSFWLTAFGLAGASHRKTRTAGATALLLAGVGHLGILWERHLNSDLRNFRDIRSVPRGDWTQLVLHVALVAGGVELLKWRRRLTPTN